jgi:predicted nucleotidyltransferase
MKPFKRIRTRDSDLTLDELLWIPEDLEKSLLAIVSFLKESIRSDVLWIGLYGSWQRGDADSESDVDIVVFLTHEVSWFDAENGIVNRSDARTDKLHWHTIEKKANAYRLDSRVYSIVVVTPGMLEYYSARGPIHLQNWAHALMNCYPLWKSGSEFQNSS